MFTVVSNDSASVIGCAVTANLLRASAIEIDVTVTFFLRAQENQKISVPRREKTIGKVPRDARPKKWEISVPKGEKPRTRKIRLVPMIDYII